MRSTDFPVYLKLNNYVCSALKIICFCSNRKLDQANPKFCIEKWYSANKFSSNYFWKVVASKCFDRIQLICIELKPKSYFSKIFIFIPTTKCLEQNLENYIRFCTEHKMFEITKRITTKCLVQNQKWIEKKRRKLEKKGEIICIFCGSEIQ